MPAKNLYRKNEEGIFCHIYNRGVESRVIFNDQEDYEIFQGFLKDYLTAPQDPETTKQDFTVNGRVFRGTPHQPKNYFNKVELISYSLMPDHFHLLLHQITRGSLESFIRSLCTRYSIYFNKKYHRSGALFAGPYKSVEIKDQALLLNLTHYLHHSGEYSSFPEYLDQRKTSWIKPEIVLSFFGKGTGDYKDFVEKYQLDQENIQLLNAITFDAETDHLERSIPTEKIEYSPPERPAESFEKLVKNQNLKPHQRVPEFLATAVIFLLLVAIGITNIMIHTTNKSKSFTLGITTTKLIPTNNPKFSPTPSNTISNNISTASEEASSASDETVKPKTILTVKVGNKTARVNIRQSPTANSKKVGTAKDRETFEFVSEDSEWYGIKLADGSTGFISSEYIEIEGNINQ